MQKSTENALVCQWMDDIVYAAEEGEWEKVKELAADAADVDAENAYGMTP